MKIVECVPNFSEGRDTAKIRAITDAISAVAGVSLLDVDPGADTNRTVVTLVGTPEAVMEGAFQGIRKAAEVLDMRTHHGAHPRMGATDVCPFVPVSGITMDDCVEYARLLGKRVGEELGIPVFLYEYAASQPDRRNLAGIRAGEYEGMGEKLQDPHWKPDFGPAALNEKAGVTAIGARQFLVAYNVNLNTKDKKIASDIALDIREAGRNRRDPKTHKFIRDAQGVPLKKPGTLKAVKAVGWYIDEYGVAQLSMNLTDITQTPVHIAFEEVRSQARKRGVRVTGSELVGLIPLKAMLDAGRYYLQKQHRSTGIPEKDILYIAVKSMGLDELGPFDPSEKIIEYRISPTFGPLVRLSIDAFADELSSESPAPGGGSVAAVAGSLGAGLAAMVANLTFGKRKWEPLYERMCRLADEGQQLKTKLLKLVDEDTEAFNDVMAAFRLPKTSEEQVRAREAAIQQATQKATSVPFTVLEACREIFKLALEAAEYGNPNSISDTGVAGEMAAAGAHGAALNVLINLGGLTDEDYCRKMRRETAELLNQVDADLQKLRELVSAGLKG
ncbi:MAG: glutamate formimidoyltransferase [FCB group bacterium]|nr:glutamate formimidoyltransferase [FCB group bacterium]